MNEKNSKYLIEKYPKLYVGHNMDICHNLVAFGFECGDGWFDIINVLSAKIEAYNNTLENEEECCIAMQVKEKYGGLRFYVMHDTDEISKWIIEAEQKSEQTCESCGEPGTIDHNAYWLSCQCDECRVKDIERNKCD